MCIKLKNDIPVCQRTRRLSCSDNPSPMKSKYRRFSSGIHGKEKRNTYRCGQRTAQDSRYGMQPKASSSLRAQAQQIQTKTLGH
ncbi:hypothetical protein TNCV_4484891 [Trichonephila clavipes]|nr:hypothetical protein TNCV_4484891 [Trichonephila clavipes]